MIAKLSHYYCPPTVTASGDPSALLAVLSPLPTLYRKTEGRFTCEEEVGKKTSQGKSYDDHQGSKSTPY